MFRAHRMVIVAVSPQQAAKSAPQRSTVAAGGGSGSAAGCVLARDVAHFQVSPARTLHERSLKLPRALRSGSRGPTPSVLLLALCF